jgi:hypothetical protein
MVPAVGDQAEPREHDLPGAVDELVRLLSTDDFDFDFDQVDTLAAAVLESGDASLQPVLERHLSGFLAAGNWFARDELARLLYEQFSIRALPALLKAMARDLHDDRDSLSTWVVELFGVDRAAARSAVLVNEDVSDHSRTPGRKHRRPRP